MPLQKTLTHFLCVCLLLSCNACSSCITVVPPDIVITGEKTMIERQIVGEYRELEKDAWVISSAKTPVYGARSTSAGAAGDRELMTALRIRHFHEEKIRKYKDEGAMGETSAGLVVYRETPAYEKDAESKRVLTSVVGEENSARTVIFRKTAGGAAGEPSSDDVLRAAKAFSEEQSLAAKKGDWLENTNGTWYRKK